MKLTETAVRRGVTFIMLYLIVVGFGLFSLARLKLDLYPKLEFPVISVITQYTGVGPYDIETVITRPIEESVATVENVETVTSTTSQGLSIVTLEFDWGTDMDQAEINIRNQLDFIRDFLPADASEPLVFAFDPSMQPILFLAVTSNLHGLAELRYISEHDIEPRIERISGVASAFTSGGMEREIRILVDPQQLRAHHLSIQQVSAALQANNLQIASGWIDNERQEFTVQAAGEFDNIEEIANTNIATVNGSVIRVKDVANVVDGFKEQRQRVWMNDKPAVMLMVQKQSDANTVQVCKAVVDKFTQIESEIPPGVELEIFWDQSEFIERSISNLGSTARTAIILAFLVLLFFLRNIRSSLIVAVSIPVSIIVTFAVMDQADLTLNIISMAGLALAVGLLVDNSIVVLESIFRFKESGEEAKTAANKGAGEVAMAITASTLTTLSVFVPILFVPGLAGEMFKEMVITICFSLAVSLFVALTLIPLLTSRLLKGSARKTKQGFWHNVSNRIQSWIDGLQHYYTIALKWSLHHRKSVFWSAVLLFFLSIVILFNLGGEFLPEGDDGFLAVSVDRAPGTSLEEMDKTIHHINNIIEREVPEQQIVYSNFGQGEGVMSLFSSRASSEGDITIRLSDLEKRDRTEFEIADSLRPLLNKLPDVTIAFEDRGEQNLFGSEGDISIKVIGHDIERAEIIAGELQERVEKINGVVFTQLSVEKPRPELVIDFDRQLIADLGLSTAQVGSIVSTSILGNVVTRYREGGDEFDIRVQLDKEGRSDKKDIENIYIMTPSGRQVPLRAIADVNYTLAPQEIRREDQERYVSLAINISGRDLKSVTDEVRSILKSYTLPNEFRTEIGGEAEDQQESFMYLGLAMMVAIVLTYMVMASQFESFLDPFVILFTIPLSIIGVAFALLLTGTDLSVMALIGIIMLVGIVVNNGIVLVDYMNQLRDRGMELLEAVVEAGTVRMRPVLMTALTTILAMFPLALGLGASGESWSPMAKAVMGGLTVATVLTLIVVPVIYTALERFLQKRQAKKSKRA